MKTNFLFAILLGAALFSCKKDEVMNEVQNETKEVVQNSGTDTVVVDTISEYYVDGVLTDLDAIVETDEQVWATHYVEDADVWRCDVFANDADFLTWWAANGASQDELDRYRAVMDVRDYAIAHNIPDDYPNEEDLNNLPQHFQDYVLDKLPEMDRSLNKNGSSDQALVHAFFRLYDGFSQTGTNRAFTTLHANYSSFRNRASSGRFTLPGVTFLCDWIWYGGQKWPFITYGGTVDFDELGSAHNRADSHF